MLTSGIIGWMLDNPEAGWVVTILYLAWEIRGPKGAIHQLRRSLDSSIIVIRALARSHNDIDTEMVDGYLVENGHEPSDFIKEDEMEDSDFSSTVPKEDNHFDNSEE